MRRSAAASPTCACAGTAVFNARAAVDLAKARLDTRLLQLALTATHAPDEALDAQFPAAAAVAALRRLRPAVRTLPEGRRPHPLALQRRGPQPAAGRPARARAAGAGTRLRPGRGRLAGEALFGQLSGLGGHGRRGAPGCARARRRSTSWASATRSSRAAATPRSAELAALAPLPETGDELRASAQGFRATRVLVQDEATEAGFRRELVGSYRYLSFATHGLMRDEIEGLAEPRAGASPPARRAIPPTTACSPPPRSPTSTCRRRFVALSACNTANFDLSQVAQDLPALASAFAVAGTPATLATLWPLNSETGKRVVPGVFAGLRDGRRAGRGPGGRAAPLPGRSAERAPTAIPASGRRSWSWATAALGAGRRRAGGRRSPRSKP